MWKINTLHYTHFCRCTKPKMTKIRKACKKRMFRSPSNLVQRIQFQQPPLRIALCFEVPPDSTVRIPLSPKESAESPTYGYAFSTTVDGVFSRDAQPKCASACMHPSTIHPPIIHPLPYEHRNFVRSFARPTTPCRTGCCTSKFFSIP